MKEIQHYVCIVIVLNPSFLKRAFSLLGNNFYLLKLRITPALPSGHYELSVTCSLWLDDCNNAEDDNDFNNNGFDDSDDKDVMKIAMMRM